MVDVKSIFKGSAQRPLADPVVRENFSVLTLPPICLVVRMGCLLCGCHGFAENMRLSLAYWIL